MACAHSTNGGRGGTAWPRRIKSSMSRLRPSRRHVRRVDSSAVAALLRAEGIRWWADVAALEPEAARGHEGMPEAVQGVLLDRRCVRRAAVASIWGFRIPGEPGGAVRAEVVKPFVSEYLAGRTPIPCTLCNNHLKFDALLVTARQIGGPHRDGALCAEPL